MFCGVVEWQVVLLCCLLFSSEVCGSQQLFPLCLYFLDHIVFGVTGHVGRGLGGVPIEEFIVVIIIVFYWEVANNPCYRGSVGYVCALVDWH